MRKASLIWPPYPFKAGFCITDDTDGAYLDIVKTVYDFLKEIGIYSTKTVWVMLPKESSGIPKKKNSPKRGMNVSTVTLENKEYLKYCQQLYEDGFEICLHGASSGNNYREDTIKAVRFIRNNFGPCDTFICHSKNAENPYWEEKVTDLPIFSNLLSSFSKHRCFGEVEGNPYFWGDVCHTNVKQIRLYRTRNTNTLQTNPSMPYYDEKKPYVKGWFSTTKRSFADCTTKESLLKLKKSNGLTVLYNYLHLYVDETTNTLPEHFKKAALRLASDKEILKETTANIMNRLRLIQSIFIVYLKKEFWVINTNDEDVKDVQILMPKGIKCSTGIQKDNVLHITNVAKNSISKFSANKNIRFKGKNSKKLNRSEETCLHFGHGKLYVNLSGRQIIKPGNLLLQQKSFLVVFNNTSTDFFRPMSRMSLLEEVRLILGQIYIVVREILFKGRSMNIHKFITGSKGSLEDQDKW